MNRNDAILNLREILLRRQSALSRSLRSELDMLSGHDADESYDDDVFSQLAESESDELEAVENALARMRMGVYGTCEECGGKISLTRLQALPYATLCIGCQRAMERQQRHAHQESKWSRVGYLPDDEDWKPSDSSFAV